jgi:hypothetical protein
MRHVLPYTSERKILSTQSRPADAKVRQTDQSIKLSTQSIPRLWLIGELGTAVDLKSTNCKLPSDGNRRDGPKQEGPQDGFVDAITSRFSDKYDTLQTLSFCAGFSARLGSVC